MLYPCNDEDSPFAVRAKPPKTLPPSISVGGVRHEPEPPQMGYHWGPIQVPHHERDANLVSGGTFIKTLSFNYQKALIAEAQADIIRPATSNFREKGTLFCYLAGGKGAVGCMDSLVFCRGTVFGSVSPTSEDRSKLRLALLPAHMCPTRNLQFAGLLREGGDQTCLVTLLVTPDGWIRVTSSRAARGEIDLSAIRYCLGKGIALVDEVRVHTVDIAGTRYVSLQGELHTRSFKRHSKSALALLPESCRPPACMPFIVSGSTLGGFHLIDVRPSTGIGWCQGIGGDLKWRDSVWIREPLHLSGIVYEVAPEAVKATTLESKWCGESANVFISDFRRFLERKFGSVEDAWKIAFDRNGDDVLQLDEFVQACKNVGYVGNVMRIWVILDTDGSGTLSLDEVIEPEKTPRLLPAISSR